jgi:hypothetical protein
MMPDVTVSSLVDSVLSASTRQAVASLLGILAGTATETRSGDFTVDSAKPGAVYEASTGATDCAVTLPTLALGDDGFAVVIIKADSSLGALNVSGTGVTERMPLLGESATFRWDGTQWWEIAHYDPDCAYLSLGSTGDAGDVTISSLVTLARDTHYRKLTLTAGGILAVDGGWAVFGETLDLTAAGSQAIRRTMTASTNATGATGGTAATAITGATLPGAPGGTAGANGGTGVGAQPTNVGGGNFYSGWTSAGGAGGAGVSAGGASRAGTGPAVYANWRATTPYGASIRNNNSASHNNGGSPAQAGSAGGGDGTNSGGGGGTAGRGNGSIFLWFRKIVTGVSTPVDAIWLRGGNGGNGGTPVAGNCGGGGAGGGGNGGLVVISFFERVGGPTTCVDVTGGNGGNGGAGIGTGAAGSGAPSGSRGCFITLNQRTGVWTEVFTNNANTAVAASGATGGTATTAQGAF